MLTADTTVITYTEAQQREAAQLLIDMARLYAKEQADSANSTMPDDEAADEHEL